MMLVCGDLHISRDKLIYIRDSSVCRNCNLIPSDQLDFQGHPLQAGTIYMMQYF
jgi:hypothetical protein